MPELMLRYRAAAWFVRAYAPEIAMGLQTAEEVKDTFDLEPAENGTYTVSLDSIKPSQKQSEDGNVIDTSTGEVTRPEPVETPHKDDEPKKAGTSPTQSVAKGQPVQTTEERTIPCPRKDNALVEDEDCFHCPERKGCPSLS